MKKTKIYATILYTLEYEHDETVKQVMDMFEQEEWGRDGVDGICQGIESSDGKMYPFFFDYEGVCAITKGGLCHTTDEITEALFE